eukprot:3331338-Rhodomonas_salina.1
MAEDLLSALEAAIKGAGEVDGLPSGDEASDASFGPLKLHGIKSQAPNSSHNGDRKAARRGQPVAQPQATPNAGGADEVVSPNQSRSPNRSAEAWLDDDDGGWFVECGSPQRVETPIFVQAVRARNLPSPIGRTSGECLATLQVQSSSQQSLTP